MLNSKGFLKLQLLLFFCCCVCLSNAQVKRSKLHKVKDNLACMYGFKNDSDAWVISPSFITASNFIKGYAIVNKGVGYGVLNEYGETIVPMVYDNIRILDIFKYSPIGSDSILQSKTALEAVYVVTLKNKMGIINLKNQIILPIVYAMVYEFSYGFAIIKTTDGLFGFTDQNGKVIKPEYQKVEDFEMLKVAVVFNNEKFGLIDSTGKVVVPIEYDELDRFNYCNTSIIRKGRFYGLIGRDGILLNAEFNSIDNTCYEKLRIVEKDGKYGVITNSGTYLIKPEFSFLDKIEKESDRLWFREGNKMGIIDLMTGKIIYEGNIQGYSELHDDWTTYFLVRINGKYGIINVDGKTMLEPIYNDYMFSWMSNSAYIIFMKGDTAVGYSVRNLRVVPLSEAMKFYGEIGIIHSEKGSERDNDNTKNRIYERNFIEGLVDSNGRMVLNSAYMIYRVSGVFIYLDRKYGYGAVNLKGNIIAKPGTFMHFKKVIKGVCIVKCESGKEGVIDNNGKLIVDTVFQVVADYVTVGPKGFTWIFIPKTEPDSNAYSDCGNGKFGLIDSGVHFVLPPIFDYPVKFSNGFAAVPIQKKFGVIRIDGKEIAPFEYDCIMPLPGGPFILKKNKKVGLLDTMGRIILPVAYDSICPFQNQYAIVEMDGRKGLINSKGEFIIQLSPCGIDSGTELLQFASFLTKGKDKWLDKDRYFHDFKIRQVFSPQRQIRFDLIADTERTVIKRLYNNSILYWVGQEDDTVYKWGREMSECSTKHPDYSEYGDYPFYGNPLNYTTKFKLIDVSDFSFCIDREELDLDNRSIKYTFVNYILFKDHFCAANLDSLFDSNKDYKSTLNDLTIEAIKSDDNLELDCSNPAKYFENLCNRYSFSEKGLCLYFKNKKRGDDLYKVIIPYAKLNAIATKDGLIEYLIKINGN